MRPVRSMGSGLLMALLVAAGCGTRVDRGDAALGPITQTTIDLHAGPAPLVPGSAAAASPAEGSRPLPTVGRAPAPAAASPQAGAGLKSQAATATTAPAPKVPGKPSSTETGPPGGGPGRAAGPPDKPAADPDQITKRSPVLLASVGTYSGPVGATLTPILQAVQVWVNSTNKNGGLSGHPVQLLVYDDGADPARAKAQTQEAVERRRVIAFLQQSWPLTWDCCVDYLATKRIPVIGSEGGSPWVYDKSPMFFPQMSSGELVTLSAMYSAAEKAIPAGITKLGFLSCTENTNCSDLPDRVWTKAAPKLGFHIVYKGRVSLAQPDFTAECLAARNAGAQVLLIALDTNSVGRIAASCARQSYRPIYGILSGVIVERMQDDPNLDGAIGATNVFPWFQTGTPQTAEYQRVMSTLGAKVARGAGAASGWVSAKLLEKAAANLPEPPTSEAILRGLWSIKNDDLGGLTQPLTFTENEPSHPVLCLWTLEVKKGAWVSFDGSFGRRCHELS